MEKTYIEDQHIEGLNFAETKPENLSYENCTFENCNFSNCDLSNIIFVVCEFENCDFSLAKITNTAFRDVTFISSKLLGMHFDDCNTFLLEMSFENCQLNLASFYKLKLKNSRFINCQLHEVDYTETYLVGSIFDNCDFAGAIFDNSNLEKCDFRTAINYIIDPERNRIAKAKFSLPAVVGLLMKHDIKID